jgi:hypothetical protein
MFGFNFAALMVDQSWSTLRGRLAGSITRETLSAYAYAIVIGTAIVILQKRLVGRHLKRLVAAA